MLVGEGETSPSWSVTMNLPWVGNEFETKNPCTSTEVIFEVQLFTLPTSDRSRFLDPCKVCQLPSSYVQRL